MANFSGGQLTTDAGVILIAQLDQHYRISEQLAGCFSDGRLARRVQHQLKDLLAQRLYDLVQGYEDRSDHDRLREDPMFGIAVGKLESRHERCAALAGKSTLNRLDQALHVSRDVSEERYVKFMVNPQQVAELLVELS